MRNYRTTVAAVSLGLLAATGAAWADDAPAKPTGPTLSDVLTASGLMVNGYVDVSYEYLVDQKGQQNFAPTYRQFDNTSNGFNFNQTGVNILMQPATGFGFVVNAIGGRDPEVIPGGRVIQAFIQYATGPLTVIGGKFTTLAGAEIIEPIGNTNASRSLLFFFEPLVHTGLRATYAANDQVSLILGVNNGWNSEVDNNTGKTVEAGASFTPNKMFSLAVQGYYGPETVFTSPTPANRALVDAVATWNATSAITVIVNADWGQQKNDRLFDGTIGTSSYYGAAGYFNYAINDNWRVSVRGEYLDDQKGGSFYTGVKQHLEEGTVTFGWMPTKNFEGRLEGRYDNSTLNSVYDGTGLHVFQQSADFTQTGDHQTTFELEALYKF